MKTARQYANEVKEKEFSCPREMWNWVRKNVPEHLRKLVIEYVRVDKWLNC